MADRSKELLQVGYYLSRFGHDAPPSTLNIKSWKDAYMLFLDSLGNGRERHEFHNSLKNTRDSFDSYFPETNREGWKDDKGLPAKLPQDAQSVFDEFIKLNEQQVFEIIKQYLPSAQHDSILKNETSPSFSVDLKAANLNFCAPLISRFQASLLTKPFVILTGLSGSGKTKLAQAFAKWLCEDASQYSIVAVGADWTNREPLLGYADALNSTRYEKLQTGVVDLLVNAVKYPDRPYFLILDEMNLSHVERYFADFLSTMESNENISLHSGPANMGEVPPTLHFPPNLFIIGTVNIDETTYMFSPKVLDRANVIEFRITAAEMAGFVHSEHQAIDLDSLAGNGKDMASAFVDLAAKKELPNTHSQAIAAELLKFFKQLQKVGAEFGYRTASEIMRFAGIVEELGLAWNTEEILDVAIMQKLLPKLHGSRKKLKAVLEELAKLCTKDGDISFLGKEAEFDLAIAKAVYPISLEKIIRMHNNLMANGFTSYAEA